MRKLLAFDTQPSIARVDVDGRGATLPQLIAVAVQEARVEMGREAMERMQASRRIVDAAVADRRVVYGVTTGLGENANVVIPADQIEDLQERILLSHAVGVGDPLSVTQVRAVMFLALQKLAMGYSGASPQMAVTLSDMLNRGVHPYVPKLGSLGASGDLAPLAHIGLVLIGHPDSKCIALRDGGYQPGSGRGEMRRAGIAPCKMSYKDGLSLLNGTNLSTALLALAVAEATQVIQAADVAAAMTLEALQATPHALDEQVHAARPHPGQVHTARVLRNLLRGSRNLDTSRVQDPYSLRCVPQIHGPVKETLQFVAGILNTELASTTDNALVFPASGDIRSAGNFMGTPLAFGSDFLRTAMTALGNASERRTSRLLDPKMNRGLPAFLVREPGLNSGFMMLQYTQAALLLDAWSRQSSSLFTISTSAGQEDIVPNSANAARQALEVVGNMRTVVAIELLAAAQGIDLREDGPGKLGIGTRAAHACIRDPVFHLDRDRLMGADVDMARALMVDGSLSQAVEAFV